MMNTKNLLNFIKAAFSARFNLVSFYHLLPNCRKRRIPFCNICFIDTGFRAIFSSCRWGVKKSFVTMMAFILRTNFRVCLRLIITFPGAIFRFISSRTDMFKLFIANLTSFFNFDSDGKRTTFSRAILSFVKPVLWNIKRFATMDTRYIFSSKRFSHAIKIR